MWHTVVRVRCIAALLYASLHWNIDNIGVNIGLNIDSIGLNIDESGTIPDRPVEYAIKP